ncbi:proepiregulin [Pseudophryne corroboree]|uniref:proepiregulin n=1 Tax=Pseudophryne corroboree TaxID=495146 RepID=UPI0030821B36
MECWRRICSVLIFFYFHMLQLACCTTVVPLCKSEDSVENCTTAMVQTAVSPRVTVVKVARCEKDMSTYCMNGHCLYLVELDEHYCRCERGYLGIRCSHLDLVKQPMSEEYLALTIFLTSLLLVTAALAAFFAYNWYKSKKSSQSEQKYKEVNTHNI